MYKKCPRAILRDLNRQYATEIKSMIDLANEHEKDMKPWVNQWDRILILVPAPVFAKAEEYLICLMKPIGFSFRSGHMLYNCGYTQNLGRGAMWLGVKIARDAIMRSRNKDDIFKRRILRSMVESLLPDEDDTICLTREDRQYPRIVFEKRFRRLAPESLKRWLLDV